jgi:trimeric autotransporter adhesin
VTFTAAVTPSSGVGTVSFSTSNTTTGLTTGLGTATVSGGTATFNTTLLPGGSNSIIATYQGDASHSESSSAPAVVSVTGQDFTIQTTSALTPSSISAGQSATAVLTITPVNGSTQTINFTNSTTSSPGSCSQTLPPGALCNFSPASVTLNGTAAATVSLTITTAPNMVPNTQAVTVTATPSSSGIPHTAAVTLTVTPTTESFTLAPTNGTTFTTTAGGSQQVQIAVSSTSTPSFITGSGSGATTALQLTYTCTGSPNLATAEITCTPPNSGQPTNATSVTITVKTTGATTQLRRPFAGSRLVYAFLIPGLFGIFFAAGTRRRGVKLLGMIVVLGCCSLGLGSCGGGGNSGGGGISNPGTPAGNYTVTITATTGGPVPLTQSTQFTLSVAQ